MSSATPDNRQLPHLPVGVFRGALAALFVVSVLACDRIPTDEARSSPNLASRAPSALQFASVETYDDALARLADRLPGFGGMFLDSAGGLVVWLTDPRKIDDAKPALREFFAERAAGNVAVASERMRQVDRMRAVAARYNFRQLHTWYAMIRNTVLPLPGVTVGDIDERRNLIMVGVKDSLSRAAAAEALESVAIPLDAIVVELFAPFEPDVTLRDRVRPVIGGVQIVWSGDSLCTLGYNVTHLFPGGQQDSDWYFVTAAHCTSVSWDVTGHSMGQPSPNTVIGYEVADPARFTNAQDPRCPVGQQCRYSDAALFRYSMYSGTHGVVAWPPVGSLVITDTKLIDAEAEPMPGMTAHKIGRTTGHTTGLVWYDCVDVNRGDVYLLCQGIATYGSDPGDSGSPVVFQNYDGTIWAYGVHWGRQTPGSPYRAFSSTYHWRQELGNALGGTLHTQASWAPPPGVSIEGHSYLPPGLACTWQATGSGGVPPYTYSWSGLLSGGGSQITGVVWDSGWLTVTVTDRAGHVGEDSFYITIDPNAPAPPDCQE